MKVIGLKELDKEDTFFHFTSVKNMESIEQNGLNPLIGGYSQGVEDTHKIYFAKGVDGVLKLWNTWLKYEMNGKQECQNKKEVTIICAQKKCMENIVIWMT